MRKKRNEQWIINPGDVANAVVAPEMLPEIIRQIREKGVPFAGGLVAEVTIPIRPCAADDYIVLANRDL